MSYIRWKRMCHKMDIHSDCSCDVTIIASATIKGSSKSSIQVGQRIFHLFDRQSVAVSTSLS